jgi:signal transduction histidine kinase
MTSVSATSPSGDASPRPLEEDGRLLILLRYVLIAAAAYLFLFEGEIASPTIIGALIAVALLSNVLLSHVPQSILTRPSAVGLIVSIDIAWIASGLWIKGNFGSDIFFLYFFILFLAAMGQNLMLIVGAGVLVGVMDLTLHVAPGEGQSIWTSPSLIRVPFIFTAALFYGHLTEKLRKEQRHAAMEKEFAEKMARVVHAQTQDLRTLAEDLRMNYEQSKKQATELEKANKVKDEFLGVMSHELRTPLNIILGYTRVILDRMLGEINPEQERALGKVRTQCKDLLSMVSDILQATKIEAEGVKVESYAVNLTGFLDGLRSAYDFPLNKEVKLGWDYPRDLPAVGTDAEKLKHILQNLINNAIKFTERGHVTVSARYLSDTRMAEFKVSDSGIGIQKELLPIIFKRFQQADSTATRDHGGVGLGLYIVNKFVDLLGGEVRVESEPGQGSTFTVTVPCEPSTEPQPTEEEVDSNPQLQP